MSVFLQGFNYIVDAYLMFAASALAGNTFMRSIAAAGFPLFARQMFDGMGIEWAATMLGCIAVLLAAFPFVFWYYGARIRAKSAYAPTAPMMKTPTVTGGGEGGSSGEEEKGDGMDYAALASVPRGMNEQTPTRNDA